MQYVPVDASDSEIKQNVAHRKLGRRVAITVGIVSVFALVGVAIKSTVGQSSQAMEQFTGNKNEKSNEFIERVADPSSNTNACDVYLGQYQATGACCDKACGSYCGAPDCQLGPPGAQSCCVRKFTHGTPATPLLCGEHLGSGNYRAAPCVLPQIAQGTMQMLVNNVGGGRRLQSDVHKLILEAVQMAISKTFGIPTNLIRTSLSVLSLAAGGRRLDSFSPLNVNYEVRASVSSGMSVDKMKAKEDDLIDAVKALVGAKSATQVAVVKLPQLEVLPPGYSSTLPGVTVTPVPLLPARTIDQKKVVKGSVTLTTAANITAEQVEAAHETAMSAAIGVSKEQIHSIATQATTNIVVTRKLARKLSEVAWNVQYTVVGAQVSQVSSLTPAVLSAQMGTALASAGTPSAVAISELTPPLPQDECGTLCQSIAADAGWAKTCQQEQCSACAGCQGVVTPTPAPAPTPTPTPTTMIPGGR